MSDFNGCGFGAISPETVLRSLISGITGIETCALRVKDIDTSQMTLSRPMGCAAPEDLWTLFMRSLVMADDGSVAIRSTTHTSLEGAGLSTCGNCASGYTWYEYMGSMFAQDENGNVYLNIVRITT